MLLTNNLREVTNDLLTYSFFMFKSYFDVASTVYYFYTRVLPGKVRLVINVISHLAS